MGSDVGDKGTCTTCTFSEDFSNYWTAVMFFKHPTNWTYKKVPILANSALPPGVEGGMTVYYTQESFSSNGNAKITAFPPGFRMTVGSPDHSTNGYSRGLKFVCLDNKNTRFPELEIFPTKPSKGGIMTVHHFPSCWNGKDLDSPNHQDHMFNTAKEAFAPAGPCPASHPVRMPQVAYETLWDTTVFNSMWPQDGNIPFIMSYGDERGYGTHADYLFGWKGDSLQRAMDHSCMFNACENGRPLKSQQPSAMNKCKVPSVSKEDIDGWLPALPGGGKHAG